MKLQNLSIIFIIIMLPIILVVSYYLNLQKSTLSMQLSYDQKLLESTKEAIEAFEVNTTEWNEMYSNLSDSKRRDVMASINTFITSLSSNLGISGVAKENLLSYIPAIAFTLYDGYYVYAPAYTPVVETDADGIAKYDTDGNLLYKTESGTTTDVNSAKKEYKHTLTTYLPYSKKYGNIIVDYTLDNYIKVYGKSGSNIIEGAGNLVYFDEFDISNFPNSIEVNGNEIDPETLSEKIAYKEFYIDEEGNQQTDILTGTYTYIYDLQNEKYYFETEEGENVNKFFRVVDGQKIYLNEDVSIGEFGAKFRKVVVRLGDTNIDVYQLLNGNIYNEWYVDKDNDGNLDERITETSGKNIAFKKEDGSTKNIRELTIYNKVKDISRKQDYSSMNYYIDAYEFTEWAGRLGIASLEISADNNPESPDSPFAGERREVIKEAVQGTLDASIMQYIKESGEEGLKIIHLSETDWDEVLRNATMIAFFEGVPIGLKYYNNYTIATSTTNNEFINKNEIYFGIDGDQYYHSLYCDKAEAVGEIKGYKNTDYIVKNYEGIYFYLHDKNNSSQLACYHCLIGSNGTKTEINNYFKIPYETALARERYVQNKNVRYVNGELRDDLDVDLITYKLNGGTQDWNFPLIVEKPIDEEIVIEGKTSKNNTNGFVYWYGVTTNRDIARYRDSNVTYDDSNMSRYGYSTAGIKNTYDINLDLELTASYKVELVYDIRGVEGVAPSPSTIATDYGIDEGEGYKTYVSEKLKNGDSITLADGKTYRFAGWSKNASRTSVDYKAEAEIIISQNTTLYDVWTEMICLTISPNTTSNEMTENIYYYFPASEGKINISDLYKITDITEGTPKIINNQNLTRANSEFKGWGESADATTPIEGDKIITEDTTIYAIWSTKRKLDLSDIVWKQDIVPKNTAGNYQYSMRFSNFTTERDFWTGYGRSDTIGTDKKGIYGIENTAGVGAFVIEDDRFIIYGDYAGKGQCAVWTDVSENITEIEFSSSDRWMYESSIRTAGLVFGISETKDINGNPDKIGGFYINWAEIGWLELGEIEYSVRKDNSQEGHQFKYLQRKSFKNIRDNCKVTIKMSNNKFEITAEDPYDDTTYTYSKEVEGMNRNSFGFIATFSSPNSYQYDGKVPISGLNVFVEE